MPSDGRKIYCKECFDSGMATGEHKNVDSHTNVSNAAKHADAHKEYFEALNAKLDEILNLLASKNASKPPKKKPVKKAVVSKKTKKNK